MGQGAYLSTGLAIRIVAREVRHVVVVVAAAVVVVVGMRVVVLGRVASAAVVIAAPPAYRPPVADSPRVPHFQQSKGW